MKKIKNNQSGFGVIETVLILVIVSLVGFTGWYVWQTNKKASDNLKPAVSSVEHKKSSTKPARMDKTVKELALASNSVTFKTPTTWTSDGIGCVKDSFAYGDQEYLDSVAILPGEKLPTVYGSGTEFFHINVCVFNNKDSLSPKDWFEDASKGGIGEGAGFPQDESSSADINGHAAFYRKTKLSYEEVSYVISAKDKLILVRARIYETDEKLPGVGDFKKFEPAIKDLVDTITIQ